MRQTTPKRTDVVLIVTTSYDEAPDYVIPFLAEAGWEFFRLDTDRYPAEILMTSRDDGSFTLSDGSHSVESESIGSIWYRRHTGPDLPPELTQGYKEFSVREARAHITGALLGLPVANWLSHPASLWAAEKKAYQLFVASELGFSVPVTRITNNPREATELGRGRTLIAKAVSAGYVEDTNGYDAIYTSRVSREDLGDLSSLAIAPVVFQELISKRADIRVTVVGDSLYSTEILSQDLPECQVDWRVAAASDLTHRNFLLPADIELRCHELVKALGLKFGAIDLVWADDGEFIFLEINPNGEWMWLEDQVGHEIASAIALVLTK